MEESRPPTTGDSATDPAPRPSRRTYPAEYRARVLADRQVPGHALPAGQSAGTHVGSDPAGGESETAVDPVRRRTRTGAGRDQPARLPGPVDLPDLGPRAGRGPVPLLHVHDVPHRPRRGPR